MEVQKGKGGIYPLAISFVMVMLLINAYCCAGAAVVVESNTTTIRYNGRLEESLIEYDLELEFLMNPYISRILQTPPKSVTAVSLIKGQPCTACSKACPKGDSYSRVPRCWKHAEVGSEMWFPYPTPAIPFLFLGVVVCLLFVSFRSANRFICAHMCYN